MKLSVLTSECDCETCSKMCHAPCCGTPENIKLLIEKGYGDRLMYDDLPDTSGVGPIIKPALKGYGGQKSPWKISSLEGCTFWENGKCQLHSLGLKPLQGKLAHHSLTNNKYNEIGDFIKDSWQTEEAKSVILIWKELNNYED